ncbi:vacuolar protein sorting-associated protein 33B [Onthophagus taurus]|uniref:vacuolar protein sorting-associated protein 33B n=1 Tax=Onthophagus taurus TaxID=166361 RepID=UPI000C205CD1|nr:vacuolar protein sorting-associated protein 33B [Onthophagus taurus]
MDDILYKKLSSLTEISKNQLLNVLNFHSGPKDLIIQSDIIKPLERICGAIWLKGNGIDKIFKLENNIPRNSTNAQYYMIYSNWNVFNQVVGLIKNQIGLENHPKGKFHIICIPQALYSFEQKLEEEGLYETVIRLYSLQWQPIHIDKGILSLEIPDMFKNLFVQQDLSLLQCYGKTLRHLYFVVGKPKLSIALGSNALNILKQLDLLNEDLGETDKIESEFGCVILLDRNVDYTSTLLTPRTYTALLKEIYNVKCGVCEHKQAEIEKYDNKLNVRVEKNPVLINFDSKRDTVYNNIKNRFFTEVTANLSLLIKQLKSESDTSKEMALDELKRYVQTQLKQVTSKKSLIANHMNAAETIINVLGNRFEKLQEFELCIMQNKSKSRNYAYLTESLLENDKLFSFRLFLLLCLTQKLSDSDVTKFLTKFFHEFGFKYGFLYNNLLKMNFIDQEQSSLQNKLMKLPNLFNNSFYQSAINMKLIPQQPEKVDVKHPTCVSYVFGGVYIPLAVQLIGSILSTTPLKEIENKLQQFGPFSITNDIGYPLTTKTVLLYVIGGVSYAEIAACNLLESLTGSRIVVMSDQVISGNDIADSILHSIIP